MAQGFTTNPINLTKVGGVYFSLGQQFAASSLPIVLTAAQLSTLTPPAALTNFALETGGNLATIAGKDFATQTTLASIKAKTDNIPPLGQALAAASVPVVLTAAQLSTLTPPAAITNFALETGGNLATLAGTVGSSKVNVNISSGSIANTSFASTIADGASVTLGAKADARSTATDTTAVTIMQVLKEISFMEQNPASRAVTGTFWQVTQPVSGTFWQTTQPVSGTVTANISGSISNTTFAVTNTGTFAVQATLAAETTKVIGVVRNSDGAGNLLTTNSTTYTAKFALDSNLLGTLGTAFSTAGKVDVKGADGDLFVRQTTAANLNATVVGTGTFAVQATLAAETTKVIGTVNQGTSPWVISGAVTNTVLSVVGSGLEATAQRVTLASDSTGVLTVKQATAANLNATVVGTGTFAVQSTLAAETTKVLGVVRNADGSGNLLTSTSNALDINLKTIAASLTLATVTTVGTVTNLSQMNGAALLMGNGVTGTGSQRVTIASDNTPFSINTKTDLTPAAPTAASVGITSAQAVASNANRKGLVLVNTSSAVISLGFGNAAVLNSGITLPPYGMFEMDEYTFDTGAVNAIASAASSNLAIQEYST